MVAPDVQAIKATGMAGGGMVDRKDDAALERLRSGRTSMRSSMRDRISQLRGTGVSSSTEVAEAARIGEENAFAAVIVPTDAGASAWVSLEEGVALQANAVADEETGGARVLQASASIVLRAVL